MSDPTDVAALRQHIKAGLLREIYRRGLLTEAQLRTLLRQQRERSGDPSV